MAQEYSRNNLFAFDTVELPWDSWDFYTDYTPHCGNVSHFCSQCFYHSNIFFTAETGVNKLYTLRLLSGLNNVSIRSHTTWCFKLFFGAFPGRCPVYTCKLYKCHILISCTAFLNIWLEMQLTAHLLYCSRMLQ